MASNQPRLHAVDLSPDDQWRVEIIIYDCVPVDEAENAYEQLNLIEADGDVKQGLDSQFQNCGGLGAFGLEGLFWSANSRYFYYTDAREGVPDGCGYWTRPLLRLDVTNGMVERLGGGPRSPDGTKLATWQGQDLVVWALEATELGRAGAFLPGAVNGPIVWSPDSQAIVYLQTTGYCQPLGNSYLIRLDLPELEPALLLESDSPSFGSLNWQKPEQLSLFEEEGQEWVYDFDTTKLTKVP